MGSTTALSGLSGYDFSSIIDLMVTSYRQPQEKMKTQKSTLETKRNAWQDMKTRLSALEKTLDTLKKTETWTATKATSSNENMLKVTGGTSGVTGDYTVKIIQLAQAQTAVTKVINVADTKTGISELADLTDLKFKINDTVIEITSSKDGEPPSLEDIQNAINRASDKTGVKASIVQVEEGQYRLSLISTKTGTANVPVFTAVLPDDADETVNSNGADNGPELLRTLGLSFDATGKIIENDTDAPLDPDKGGITVKAQDAEIVVNGLKITSSSNKITTAINGITLNLLDADPSKTIRVTVEEDYSVAEKAIKDFVEKYNSVMNSIASYVNYDKSSETAGTLYADPTLRAIESRLRSMMGGTWETAGNYKILSDIGISTSSDNYGKNATLTFDTAKFKEAMANDLQGVANLFGASYNGVENPQGVANVLKDYLNPMVKYQGSLDQTYDSYTRQIKDVEDRIAAFEDRAIAYEERLRLQFARLESALASLSQQSASLANMLSALEAQKKS